MFFPKLFELFSANTTLPYSSEIITKIDDYLGNLSKGTSFKGSDVTFVIDDYLLAEKLLNDLVKIGIIEEFQEESSNFESDNSEIEDDKAFILLIEPNKIIDPKYLDYISKKRSIDSFSIIFEKTQANKSGALALIDLKGYSKNVNNDSNNMGVLLLIDKIQNIIDDCIKPYFFNSYSGIEIKHNGDGWFFFFINENESYEFLEQVLVKCRTIESIKNDFLTLKTSLKCYIHHAKEIEKIYKVDTLHFDMEGKDVILIHMLEKPIEKVLYDNVIPASSNFIAITEHLLLKLNPEYRSTFSELQNVKFDTKDSENNSKFYLSNLKIFFKEFV